jgi:hypothetical protein
MKECREIGDKTPRISGRFIPFDKVPESAEKYTR